ncbi:MAG: hypothetical protein HFG73_01350 [Hungatella sp.]|nr:hypothetical protein [Hungatella sp.]
MRWGKGPGGLRQKRAPCRGFGLWVRGRRLFWGMAWGSLISFGFGGQMVCQAAGPGSGYGAFALAAGEFFGGRQVIEARARETAAKRVRATRDISGTNGGGSGWDTESLSGQGLGGMESQGSQGRGGMEGQGSQGLGGMEIQGSQGLNGMESLSGQGLGGMESQDSQGLGGMESQGSQGIGGMEVQGSQGLGGMEVQNSQGVGGMEDLDGLGLDDMEQLDRLEELEGQEDVSEEELNQALEEYFKDLDVEELGKETVTSEKITNPVLKVETERSGRLRYTLPNGNYFVSSVPCGMITSDPVELELPDGTVGLVQKDDVKQTFPETWRFTEKGVYYVRILVLQPPGNLTVDYNIYEVNFYFTIIDRTNSTLGAVPAPEGFVITGVRLDGKPQEVEQERCYFLKDDGYYEIEFESRGDLQSSARIGFLRDTKAPFLSFSKDMEPGGIPSEVEFYPSEPGCQVYMHYNGNGGYAVSNRLTAAGAYSLSVEDKAGNSRTYYVKLRQTYKLLDWRILLAAAVAVVFMAIKLLAARRDMRVL